MAFDSSFFANLSMPGKIIMALAGGAGLVGVAAAFNPGFAYIMLAGLAVVALILIGYVLLLKWLKRRQSNSFGSQLGQSSKASGVSAPEDLAKLDSLRNTFEDGLRKFRARGKDLYTLPWYLIIGESGAGKTEAIRRCGLGFPPGMQDELQGVGGTVNMNWWFTNRAIILDTAGKMVFQGIDVGQTKEWTEFLKLLKKNRRNCPINGLVLVIPADGFFLTEKDKKDGLDLDKKIERKSTEIAQQLELIKQELEVRFPVYLMITKADLIVGFREFFDGLDDPALQHQILGWSKPGSLDESFQPEDVSTYLETVRQRLLRRRAGLMLDPVHSENPQERRVDEVDSLYTFPNNLVRQIGPPLQRYLQQIFAPTVWSGKTLLFRGIYFTSAMRDGAALDEEIAEMLDVPLDSLPEGRVWERERAFFLQDVFRQKITPEKGLVTRADNIGRLQRRRRGAILGTAIVGVLLLIGFTWWSADVLESSISSHGKFWNALSAKRKQAPWKLVVSAGAGSTEYIYRGSRTELALGGKGEGDPDYKFRLHELPLRTLKFARAEIAKPKVFWWIPGESNVLQAERFAAHRALFESSFLEPVIEAAMAKMLQQAPDEGWRPTTSALGTSPRTDALAALIELLSIDDPAALKIEPLLAYVTPIPNPTPEPDPANENDYRLHLPDFEQALAGTYAGDLDALERFLATSPNVDDPAGQGKLSLAAVVERAVDAFSAFALAEKDPDADLRDPSMPFANKLDDLDRLREGLHAAEKDLGAVERSFKDAPKGVIDHGRLIGMWTDLYTAFRTKQQEMELAVTALAKDSQLEIGELKRKLRDDYLRGLKPAFERLEEATGKPDPGAANDTNLPEHSRLAARVYKKLEDTSATAEKAADARMNDFTGSLEKILKEIRAPQDDPTTAAFRVRARALDIADKATPETALGAAGALARLRQAQTPAEGEEDPVFKSAADVASFLLQLKNHQFISETLARLRTLPEEKAKDVKPFPVDVELLKSGTTVPEGAKLAFHPQILEEINELQDHIRKVLDTKGATLREEELEARFESWKEGAFADHVRNYVNYWADDVLAAVGAQNFKDDSWEAFKTSIVVKARRINQGLERFADARLDALQAAAPVLDAGSQEAHKARLDAVNQELAKLRDNDFATSCDDCTTKWATLGEDAQAARLRILGLTAIPLQRDYLDIYDKGVPFWDACIEKGLQLIASHAERDANAWLAELKRDFRDFPLVKTATPVTPLPLDKVERAHSLVRQIRGVAVGVDRGAAAIKTVAEGARTRSDRINRQLTRIVMGAAQLENESEREWFDRLSEVLAFLLHPDLECNVVILNQYDFTERSGALGVNEFRREHTTLEVVENEGDGRVDVNRLKRTVQPKESIRLSRIDAPLTIYFYPNTSPNGQRKQFLSAGATRYPLNSQWARWGAVAALHLDGVKATPDGDGVLCEVPLKVAGRNGPYAYWLGIRFNRPLPDLDKWPTKTSWPVAR